MKIALIVAMDEADLIGRDNDLPWRLPADLQYFRRVTMGKPIIMGRHTHDSIGRPLPGRHNIVVTRTTGYHAEGCTVVNSLDAAFDASRGSDEVMVMGGASLYAQCLPLADRLYLTRVHARFEGDTWFPSWDPAQWRETARQDHAADERNAYAYSFIELERRDG